MSKSIRSEIIKALAAGQFISGQSLGESLGISRAAVSKHVKHLTELGLDIYSVTGKGYKLATPLSLLNKVDIVKHLDTNWLDTKVDVHFTIDSTNSYLLRRIPNQVKVGQVCVAESQQAGRGRRGRQWVSPFGSHVYMSMYWHLEQGMSAAMGLSMVTALAISDAIHCLYDVDVELKWPNDIYINGVKLAGILIELEGQAMEPCHCILGIGLNVKMPKEASQDITQPWTDLQRHVNQPIDRNELVAVIISCLRNRLQQHANAGMNAMLKDWHQRDVFLNKPVKLITGEKHTLGTCRGINSQGALLLEQDGQIKPIYGGEVSLRGVS